ncbi:simple sugar transport system permease protein [Kaistia soli DSM 19436]|uniref:Simple sugar transport system permease protein n=1 Tax=Kaistia soli DSM 19436 TaxID=1122133 RepID=A0A1M4XFF5_9HYPH|nr:ABC transporter permease [Kaistia soli]SHE92198.1 simple sugar transport system permease protein [Kaistia soli DSM 19436]
MTQGRLFLSETGRIVMAAIFALAVTLIIIFFASKTPWATFETFVTSPLSSKRTIGIWIDDSVKLALAGLAFSLVFQARQFALGVQGQVYIGGLFATLVAFSPIGTTWLALPAGILAAMIGGAFIGFIPGYAKSKLGANEIVSSLMLNYIAYDICNYILRVYLASLESGLTTSAPFPAQSIYPAFIPRTRVDLGIVIALATTVVVWFLLYRTAWGLKLRLTGHNARFAAYSGIRSSFIMVSAMTAAGAIGGLLGAVFVQGTAYGKLSIGFEAGMAFEGILITIVARNRPLAIPFVALGYGYLRQGAALMNYRADVPAEVIGIVQGIVILLVASSFTVPGKAMLARLMGNRTAASRATS